MNRLELQNAMKLIEKFEELQEEFNSKYEDFEVEIDNDGDLKISNDYFIYEDVNKLEQVIIDYKRIFKG
ncbi:MULTISPECIES: hypothetical protein [unclassified Spiroplasma]|uniref:hypothetical protein n=1 Tax=unclassified Spiroplasma TaxID=2637901 RepID=UPI0013C8C4CA|nr:hypothetical protein [Spiroplasma endosymbiont of Danaus chrysippus]CAB1054088.1 hypothetical protein [Spiroplasma endosymbiont of Danaus chrysippus]CAB1054763.1 hypothetical protein [Spiroplasma endosymbiont of Danaus chrysippus]